MDVIGLWCKLAECRIITGMTSAASVDDLFKGALVAVRKWAFLWAWSGAWLLASTSYGTLCAASSSARS